MSDLLTAPRPHLASLERPHQPDPAHERHDGNSNPAASEMSSQAAETATHAGSSGRWTKLASRLPWAAASTVVLGFMAVVLWRIYAPSPDVWTDDAYVHVHYATIAPRVPGQVSSVRVDDNDMVKAGQVLAELDDRDFRVALEQAQAQVAAARASITPPRVVDPEKSERDHPGRLPPRNWSPVATVTENHHDIELALPGRVQETVVNILEMASGVSAPWHMHPGAQEIIYVLDGSLTAEVEGQETRAIKAGEIALIPAEILHLVRNESPGEMARALVSHSRADKKAPFQVIVKRAT